MPLQRCTPSLCLVFDSRIDASQVGDHFPLPHAVDVSWGQRRPLGMDACRPNLRPSSTIGTCQG